MGGFEIECALGSFDLYKRIGFTIMFKGTVWAAIEVLRRFYLFESV